MALRVFVWVWVPGLAYGLLASGELEVEAAAFEHDQGDEVAEVPVAVAHLDGGLDLVVCFVKFLWAVSAFLLVRLSGCF